MTAAIGIAGNLLLSLCGVPLLVSSFRGTSYTSPWFLAAWMAGEVLAALYGLLTGVSWIIVGNYCVSMVLIVGIAWAQRRRKLT
jgi:fucose 4-O-acetylase-like acetyltransferase